jgi:hypothetical protein
MAELQRKTLGRPSLAIAVIGHPLMGRGPAEIDAAADEVVEAVRTLFGRKRPG